MFAAARNGDGTQFVPLPFHVGQFHVKEHVDAGGPEHAGHGQPDGELRRNQFAVRIGESFFLHGVAKLRADACGTAFDEGAHAGKNGTSAVDRDASRAGVPVENEDLFPRPCGSHGRAESRRTGARDDYVINHGQVLLLQR